MRSWNAIVKYRLLMATS